MKRRILPCSLCLRDTGSMRVGSELARQAFGEKLMSVHADCDQRMIDTLRKRFPKSNPVEWPAMMRDGKDL